MAWRIVQQPNGRYAWWSDIVDYFLMWDATREQIIEKILADALVEAKALAKRKLQTADDDNGQDGSASRWARELATVRAVHGQEKYEAFLKEYAARMKHNEKGARRRSATPKREKKP